MANFSCIGHDMVLDQGLKEKIKEAIQKVLTKDRVFNFYFLKLNRFSSYMYEAVQQLKVEKQDFTIRTILVVTGQENVPARGDFDEILVAPNCIENGNFTVNVKRAQRWMIEQSDYLLMYFYPEICDEDQGIVAFIQKRAEGENLVILDLTDRKTSTIIKAQFSYLRPNQKNVREKLLIGKTNKEIAEEMGISVTRVRQLYYSSCAKLYNLAYRAINN